MIANLEQKHTEELMSNRQYLEEQLPLNFKLSAKLLNLRNIEQKLAASKQYAEAHKVQAEVGAMEEMERKQYLEIRQKKIIS